MDNEYTGFVYIWKDKHRQMFYIGSHQGTTTDGYVSSSNRFNHAYRKRPNDFKRRILEYVCGSMKQLHDREQHWLSLIPLTELTIKYYNVKRHAAGGNGGANKGNKNCGGWNKGISKEMLRLRKQQLFCLILDAPKPKPKPEKSMTDQSKQLIGEAKRLWWKQNKETYVQWNKGKSTMTEEQIRKMQSGRKGKPAWNRGLSNSVSADNGRRGAEKQRERASGRKRYYLTDTEWTWIYPRDSGAWFYREKINAKKWREVDVTPPLS